mmetsp:Transcript_2445/g.3728  ORF Transcript_2445/g.3728 Transcript_2445/m.3728 type:complete len:293 (+) Transcript_2445:203-1081(+)
MERNGYTDYNDENDTAIGAGTSLVGRTQDITLGMPIVNAASGDYDDYDNNNDDIKNDSDNNDYANDHNETTTGSDKQPFWDEAKAVLLPHASLPIQEEENLMSRSQTDDHHLQKNISSAGCRKEGKTEMDVIQHSTHCNEIKTRVQKKEEEEDKTQIQDDCRDEVACGGCNVMNSSIFGDGGIFQTSIIDEEPRTSLNKNDDESVVAVMKEEEEEEEADCLAAIFPSVSFLLSSFFWVTARSSSLTSFAATTATSASSSPSFLFPPPSTSIVGTNSFFPPGVLLLLRSTTGC